jgi:hypothetical protein
MPAVPSARVSGSAWASRWAFKEAVGMVPMTMRVPVPFEYVFPHGALCLVWSR